MERWPALLSIALALVGPPARASIELQLDILTVDGAPDLDPAATAGQTVFVSLRSGSADVFRVDAVSNVILVAGGPSSQTDPDVDGDIVVFVDDLVGNDNIGTVDLGTGLFDLLTVDSGSDRAPAISGDSIYFVTNRSGNDDIFVIDRITSNVTSFAATAAVEGAPSADGPLVAWHALSGGDSDVLASFDGGAPFVVAGGPEVQFEPHVSGDRIVYHVDDDVAVYDRVTGATTRITDDAFAQTRARIHGDHVVWSDDRNGNQDVFLHDLLDGRVYQLTDDPADQLVGDLHDGRVVFQDDRLGNDNVWEVRFELCEHAQVVPPPLADVEAASSAAAPFAVAGELRLQQVFDAAAFPCPSTSRPIRGMWLRADAGSGPAAWTVPDVEIRLSTTVRPPDGLGPSFALNTGPDEQLVHAGPLELATQAAGPPGGPLAFDLWIPFETPFPYDPSAGNLLLDVRLYTGSEPGGGFAFDAEGSPGNETSQLVALSASATSGIALPGGLVTRFQQGAPPPVPALSPALCAGLTAALLGVGAARLGREPRVRAQ